MSERAQPAQSDSPRPAPSPFAFLFSLSHSLSSLILHLSSSLLFSLLCTIPVSTSSTYIPTQFELRCIGATGSVAMDTTPSSVPSSVPVVVEPSSPEPTMESIARATHVIKVEERFRILFDRPVPTAWALALRGLRNNPPTVVTVLGTPSTGVIEFVDFYQSEVGLQNIQRGAWSTEIGDFAWRGNCIDPVVTIVVTAAHTVLSHPPQFPPHLSARGLIAALVDADVLLRDTHPSIIVFTEELPFVALRTPPLVVRTRPRSPPPLLDEPRQLRRRLCLEEEEEKADVHSLVAELDVGALSMQLLEDDRELKKATAKRNETMQQILSCTDDSFTEKGVLCCICLQGRELGMVSCGTCEYRLCCRCWEHSMRLYMKNARAREVAIRVVLDITTPSLYRVEMDPFKCPACRGPKGFQGVICNDDPTTLAKGRTLLRLQNLDSNTQFFAGGYKRDFPTWENHTQFFTEGKIFVHNPYLPQCEVDHVNSDCCLFTGAVPSHMELIVKPGTTLADVYASSCFLVMMMSPQLLSFFPCPVQCFNEGKGSYNALELHDHMKWHKEVWRAVQDHIKIWDMPEGPEKRIEQSEWAKWSIHKASKNRGDYYFNSPETLRGSSVREVRVVDSDYCERDVTAKFLTLRMPSGHGLDDTLVENAVTCMKIYRTQLAEEEEKKYDFNVSPADPTGVFAEREESPRWSDGVNVLHTGNFHCLDGEEDEWELWDFDHNDAYVCVCAKTRRLFYTGSLDALVDPPRWVIRDSGIFTDTPPLGWVPSPAPIRDEEAPRWVIRDSGILTDTPPLGWSPPADGPPVLRWSRVVRQLCVGVRLADRDGSIHEEWRFGGCIDLVHRTSRRVVDASTHEPLEPPQWILRDTGVYTDTPPLGWSAPSSHAPTWGSYHILDSARLTHTSAGYQTWESSDPHSSRHYYVNGRTRRIHGWQSLSPLEPPRWLIAGIGAVTDTPPLVSPPPPVADTPLNHKMTFTTSESSVVWLYRFEPEARIPQGLEGALTHNGRCVRVGVISRRVLERFRGSMFTYNTRPCWVVRQSSEGLLTEVAPLPPPAPVPFVRQRVHFESLESPEIQLFSLGPQAVVPLVIRNALTFRGHLRVGFETRRVYERTLSTWMPIAPPCWVVFQEGGYYLTDTEPSPEEEEEEEGAPGTPEPAEAEPPVGYSVRVRIADDIPYGYLWVDSECKMPELGGATSVVVGRWGYVKEPTPGSRSRMVESNWQDVTPMWRLTETLDGLVPHDNGRQPNLYSAIEREVARQRSQRTQHDTRAARAERRAMQRGNL